MDSAVLGCILVESRCLQLVTELGLVQDYHDGHGYQNRKRNGDCEVLKYNTLFTENPQAWVNGPVYPDIFLEYKDKTNDMCEHLHAKDFD